eukprot:6307540-Amphidinium_carterae.1
MLLHALHALKKTKRCKKSNRQIWRALKCPWVLWAFLATSFTATALLVASFLLEEPVLMQANDNSPMNSNGN